VNESGTTSFLVNPLEVDNELIEIVFGVSEDLCTKKGNDVIRYHRWGFILKVGVINAELRVKPVDLVRD